VLGDDDGIWRRLIVLPFNRKFEPHERDPLLEMKLIQEADGILMWMIQGAKLWCMNGLNLCNKIKRKVPLTERNRIYWDNSSKNALLWVMTIKHKIKNIWRLPTLL